MGRAKKKKGTLHAQNDMFKGEDREGGTSRHTTFLGLTKGKQKSKKNLVEKEGPKETP